jgi:hypothetical protein
MSTINPRNSNTDDVRQTDRAATGPQPDMTPATGGSPTGGGGGGGGGGTTVPYYATLALLRAAPAPANDTFALLGGYDADKDGGGGWFVFQTGGGLADDGGTRIVPGGSAPVINSSGVTTTPGTTPTVGFWWRLEAQAPFSGGEGRHNVMWFGAKPDNFTDNAPAFRLCFASILYSSGAVYAPSGQYKFITKWVCDGNLTAGSISIIGDGVGATIFEYGMEAADTCMWEVKNGFGFCTIRDIQINRAGYAGLTTNPSVMWIHDTTSLTVINVQFSGLIASVAQNAIPAGGVLYCGGSTNTNLTLIGVSAVGGAGVQLFWGGGSGLVSSCNFTAGDRQGAAWVSGTAYGVGAYVKASNGQYYMSRNVQASSTTTPQSDTTNWEYARKNAPCAIINGANTLKLNHNFFSGGGPYRSHRFCALTRTGANFTITVPSGHGYIAGQYVTVMDATQAGFVKWWKLASVTATTVTVTFANALVADTVTISDFYACLYVNALTESDMSGCFFNTGGSPGSGSCGVFLDAWNNAGNTIGEFAISDCICDFGNTAFFLHGTTNADPGSSLHAITLNNCKPNGGPRDELGCFHIEGVTFLTMDGCRAFPGNNNPPAAGITFTSVLISDGGQAFKTQDITITGGNFTNKNSSALYPGATIIAFQLDGSNVYGTSIQNPGVDTAKTVYSLVNGATCANDNVIQYKNAGRWRVVDTTGTHDL